jgi:pimeloyl-ACP methyl ester carboxylesterase
MTGRRTWALAVGLALVASACMADAGVSRTGSEPSDTGAPEASSVTAAPQVTDPPSSDPASGAITPGEADRFEPAPIEWEPLDAEVELGTLAVPIDYDDPDGPTLELAIARRAATDPSSRIGTLLVNPGGPGFGGTLFAILGDRVYDTELLRHFDIVGWDPRGTGDSEPAIDCIDDWDVYVAALDVSDDLAADNLTLAQQFAAECERKNADIIQHVGTNNSARDMDTIRRALGEDTISYFGFSYGSELGGTWATLFPETVRAAVLDGASDPEADRLESSLQQIAGFEATLGTFLDRCSADPSCALHNDGDAGTAFDQLMSNLEDDPVPSRSGRPAVGRTVATIATIQAMYNDSFWPQLERALADATEGRGAGLLSLYDSYYQRQNDGTYGDELEAFQVISCADTADRPSTEQLRAESERFTEVAPRLVPPDSEPGYFCTFLPEALDPRVAITGEGAGPIVVIGTTGDPATPFESTRAMASTLADGRFVIVEADQHTGYGVNRCVVELVNRYLVDLEPPADGAVCD